MSKMIGATVVVIAQNLNPSIFSQLWLVRQGIFKEEDFRQSLFSPAAVNVKGSAKELLVVPERLQLIVTQEEDRARTVKEVIGTIVPALPHTPYKALGFNFDWASEPQDKAAFPEVIRAMFLSSKNPLARFFGSEDSRFGVYLSKQVGEMRLRLDVKPLIEDTLRFNFNFHKDVSDDKAVDTIVAMLDFWTEAEKMTEEMVKEASKGWSTD